MLHPVGVLRVSQRAVPLDLTLDKVGNQKPTDVKRVTLSVAAGGLAKRGDVDEQFAPAQFQDFDDATKLSKPAFQPLHGGIDLSVAGAQLTSAAMVKRIVRYEQIIIDSELPPPPALPAAVLGAVRALPGRSRRVTLGALEVERDKLQPFDEKVEVGSDAYAVAFQADNTPVRRRSPARRWRPSTSQLSLAADPTLAATMHVIPSYEVAA